MKRHILPAAIAGGSFLIAATALVTIDAPLASAAGTTPANSVSVTNQISHPLSENALGLSLDKNLKPTATVTKKAVPSSTQMTLQDKLDLGPKKWTGAPIVHPEGGYINSNVSRWANVVLVAMKDRHIPRKYLPGILSQMQQESMGDPNAVNNYDSNAAMGTPSKGLLQVIAPTYQTYAAKGLSNPKYLTNPYANVYASLGYVKDSYGMSKFESWNSGANQAY